LSVWQLSVDYILMHL